MFLWEQVLPALQIVSGLLERQLPGATRAELANCPPAACNKADADFLKLDQGSGMRWHDQCTLAVSSLAKHVSLEKQEDDRMLQR